MVYTKLTKKALKLAYQKHHNQFDKSGVPYIFHPYHLAIQMIDEKTTIIALLHDILEDTDTTIEELKSLGFSDDVADAIVLLTKDKSISYEDYINKIKANPLAKIVKIADLKHNLDTNRLIKISDQDKLRIEKYEKALQILDL